MILITSARYTMDDPHGMIEFKIQIYVILIIHILLLVLLLLLLLHDFITINNLWPVFSKKIKKITYDPFG